MLGSVVMVDMPMFKTFGKVFQQHLQNNTAYYKKADIVDVTFINFGKNFIYTDGNEKTCTQNQKFLGKIFIFSEKTTKHCTSSNTQDKKKNDHGTVSGIGFGYKCTDNSANPYFEKARFFLSKVFVWKLIIFAGMEKAALLILIFISVKFSAQKKADFVLYNARIYSVDHNFSVHEAMAVAEGKVVALGKSKDILKAFRTSPSRDLKGKTVFPGFIDAHCHFTGYALDGWKCDLYGTKSWDEVVEKMIHYADKAPAYWIYGRSWDQNSWPVKEFPDRQKLDDLFPDRPVYLKRIDGHAAIANGKALEIAGINPETKIQGGEIEVKDGRLTGLLLDNALELVEQHIPEIDEELALKYIADLQKECFSYGLTSLHDCGITDQMFTLLQKAQKKKILKMNIFALLADDPTTYDTWIRKGRFTDGRITFGGYKFFADGALGSRGACLLHDYSDHKNWHGFLLSDQQHFEDLAHRLIRSNLQMCTHAIGDSANRVILNTYGEVLLHKNDRRWRIEHAQIVDPEDVSLFGKYAVIPSVQPTHATSDMHWAGKRLGKERLRNSYIYKQLLDQNGWLPLGTDFPVEGINPVNTFFAAVFRKDQQYSPENGFQTENALTREQALRGMTIWAAKASFDETEKGSLEPGKSADFVIMDRDLMMVPESEVLQAKVLETWSCGEKVF